MSSPIHHLSPPGDGYDIGSAVQSPLDQHRVGSNHNSPARNNDRFGDHDDYYDSADLSPAVEEDDGDDDGEDESEATADQVEDAGDGSSTQSTVSRKRQRDVPCTKCGRMYSSENSLRNHIRIKHSFANSNRQRAQSTDGCVPIRAKSSTPTLPHSVTNMLGMTNVPPPGAAGLLPVTGTPTDAGPLAVAPVPHMMGGPSGPNTLVAAATPHDMLPALMVSGHPPPTVPFVPATHLPPTGIAMAPLAQVCLYICLFFLVFAVSAFVYFFYKLFFCLEYLFF